LETANVTEAELLNAIIEAARILGWKIAHFRPARTKYGWATAVQADGAGFPDLVLVRDRIVYAELKADRGRLSEIQKAWIGWLEVAGAEIYLWKPDDWMSGRIDGVLR
jgi:hypothetical protein